MPLFLDIEKKLPGFTLSMQLETGDETTALLGASGSGKSMTLRCIAGVDRPDRGRIVLNGQVLFDSARHICLPPQQRRVGLMFQHYALFPHMSVFQNLLCGARRYPRGAARNQAAYDMLDRFELAPLARRYPHQLSGGQQQRVALARLLISDPGILMMDEPFSALDSHLRFRMEQSLREVIRDFPHPVLLVSHNRDEVFRLAQRVSVLDQGRVERTGTRQEVFSDPGTRSACLLTGCKNLSSVQILESGQAYARDWGISLSLPMKPGTNALGIRMHAIEPGPGENTLTCLVREVIENPFSYTVMLHPLDAPEHAEPIGWEMEKPVWKRLEASHVQVHIPSEHILQLKG